MHSAYLTLLGMDLLKVSETDLIRPLMRDSKTELIGDEFHLTIRPHGIGLVADFDGRVSTVFFYSGEANNYRQFAGELPGGIAFGSSKSVVHKLLGQPNSNGGGETVPFLGKTPKWERYDHSNYSLHIQYVDNEGSISLVTLMRPDSAPK